MIKIVGAVFQASEATINEYFKCIQFFEKARWEWKVENAWIEYFRGKRKRLCLNWKKGFLFAFVINFKTLGEIFFIRKIAFLPVYLWFWVLYKLFEMKRQYGLFIHLLRLCQTKRLSDSCSDRKNQPCFLLFRFVNGFLIKLRSVFGSQMMAWNTKFRAACCWPTPLYSLGSANWAHNLSVGTSQLGTWGRPECFSKVGNEAIVRHCAFKRPRCP